MEEKFMFNNSTAMTMPVAPMGFSGGYGNNGMFGDGGWWAIIILLALFGGFGNGGFGNGFGGNGFVGNEVQRGFDTATITNKLNGIENGLCDGFYAQNTTMLQGFNGLQQSLLTGFHGVDNAICNLGYQNQQCCCETNRNIDSVRFENAQNTCAITNAIHAEGEETRKLIQANEIQSLRDKVADLQLAQSQCAQNAYLVNQLRPCPIPAYLTCSPYASYNYNNCGCGCNGF